MQLRATHQLLSACPFRSLSRSRRGNLRVQAAKISTNAKDAPTVTTLEWKTPLNIIRYPDPRLRAVNANIACFDDSLMALAKEMIVLMYQDDGVGLAAPQVGMNVRLMVFNEFGRERPGEEQILVNPEITSSTGPKVVEQEGCLSFPALQADVERPFTITVKAQNAKGEPVTFKFDDWVARIFQHEFDHLQGVLFHDRMKPLQLARIRPGLVLLEEEFIAQHPGVPIQRLQPPKVFKGFGAK